MTDRLQVFHEREAVALYGRCRCADDEGACPFCTLYYEGPDEAETEELRKMGLIDPPRWSVPIDPDD